MDTGITRIKFCGIMNLKDAFYASLLGVDAIGFIFTKSKRMITQGKAKKIIKQLPPLISKVGVFMNDSFDKIIDITNYTGIDIIQLHGVESPDFCKKVEKMTGKKIIKSLKISKEINDRELFDNIQKYKRYHILFDSGAGGGKVFDWSILKNIDIPFTVAGGLSPLNVNNLIKLLNPYAVDVSSGIEKTIGKKDFKKMKQFVKEVRE
jgi:phosphoribosylanthranilate isomerase